MVISAKLKSLSARAIRAEIEMKIDEYDRLVGRMQLLFDGEPSEKMLNDLKLTVCQSKIIANKIYQLRHKN